MKPKLPAVRPYRSSVREHHAAQTRERIIAAAVNFLKSNEPDTLTLPKIGALAGISSPTVYAYFPTIDDLYEGIYESIERRVGLELDQYPHHLEDLPRLSRMQFPAYSRHAKTMRALLLSPAYHRVRQSSRKHRLKRWVAIIQKEMPDLSPAQARLGAAAVNSFWVPGMWHWLTANCGLSVEEATRVATWATASLIEAFENDPEALTEGVPASPADADLESVSAPCLNPEVPVAF